MTIRAVAEKLFDWTLRPVRRAFYRDQSKRGELDAGSLDWRNFGNAPSPGSADQQFFRSNPRFILDRSRRLCGNDPLVSTVQTRTANQQIRNGIQPQFRLQLSSKPERNLELNKKWLDSFLEWAEGFDQNGHFFADSVGIRNYWVIQHLLRNDKFSDGGVFIRRVYDESVKGVCPLKLELLEIDHLDYSRDQLHKDGSETLHGFKFDSDGKRLGVWLYKHHPHSGSVKAAGQLSVFVPESDYIYYFRPKKSSQRIGRPDTTAAVQLSQDLQGYQDLTMQKVKEEATAGPIVKNAPAGMDASAMRSPTDFRNGSSTEDTDYPTGFKEGVLTGTNTATISGLTMRFLPKDTEIQRETQKNPGPQYQDFIKQNGRRAAASMGVSDQLGTGNISDTVFAGLRSASLDQAVDFSVEQFFLGAMGLGKIHAWFIDSMYLSGLAPTGLPGYLDRPWKWWRQVTCEFPGFRSFNRHQDMNASKSALDMDLSNFVAEAAVEGGNAYKNLEINTDFKLAQERARGKILEERLKNAEIAAQIGAVMNPAETAEGDKDES